MVTEMASPGFKRIAPEYATLDRIAYGCIFTEGPVWNAREGYLVWSDIIGDTIWKWVPGQGSSVLLRPSGKADGITYDRQGRLVVAGWSRRTVWRIEYDGSIVTLASHYQGKKLNSPNDIVVKSDGAIYFTDSSGALFNLAMGGSDLQKYLDFEGVYRLDPEDGTLALLVDDFEVCNGLAFSPDESLLYINDTLRCHIRVFSVNPDGTIGNGRLFADVTGDDPGHVDGMKVDVEGNVYCSGPGGVHVFDAHGNHLGRIKVPEDVSNMGWGDKDWRSLYVAARSSVYRIRLEVPGIPVRPFRRLIVQYEFELVAGAYGSATDGPAWDGEALLFTHVAESRILRYDPQSGEVTEFRRWLNLTKGLAFSADGTLYGCQSGSRRIVRFNPDGSTSLLADRLGGHLHNHPDDLVVDRQGRIWFSDPYDPIPAPGPQIQGPLDHASVLRLEKHHQDWTIRRMTYDTTAPSAVLLSQDERTLYVPENSSDEWGRRELRAYPIDEDGSLGPCTVLHTFGADYRGVHRGVEGMCLDSEGNIIACAGWEHSGPGPLIYVFSPTGRVLETHSVPADQPTNCTFGDPNLSTLYVTTSGGHLYRVRNTGRQGSLLFPPAR